MDGVVYNGAEIVGLRQIRSAWNLINIMDSFIKFIMDSNVDVRKSNIVTIF